MKHTKQEIVQQIFQQVENEEIQKQAFQCLVIKEPG